MRINAIEIPDADIYEIVLDHFPDLIHSIDDRGTIVYANRAAERLLGYRREDLLGMDIRQIYADEVLEEMERGFRDLKRHGDKVVESVLKTREGDRVPVEIRSFGIYDDEGRFLRTFSILRDLREIKRLQASLIHQSRLAAIGELASGIAHDINNPLTVILFSNEMALREIERGTTDPRTLLEKVKVRLTHSERASQTIQKLSDHLRNFSRGMAEHQERVDLADVVEDAIFITSHRIRQADVQVQNRVEKGRFLTLGSPNQLEQVFVNLIGNACDAMAGREPRLLEIGVAPAAAGDANYWRCDVSDTGTGIPEGLREEVFQSFFTTKEKGKGTGLGLSIARGIVRNHRGDIMVESTVGKGTTFSVILPRLREEPPAGASDQPCPAGT
jgi:PAS domain S-box-containing protein